MGYRSEVAYTIRFDDSDKGRQTFDIFLTDARQKEETKGVFNDERSESAPDAPLVIDRAELQINFRASDVKWYPDFSDVKCHDALFALAREYIEDLTDQESDSPRATCCMGAIFVLIGEDINDIQEECHGNYDWGWLGVSRQIITDWD